MHRYQPHTRRPAFALAAAAMTALTIGVAVLAPARFDASRADGWAIADAAAPIAVAISPARVDIVAVRAGAPLDAARLMAPRARQTG
jgi:hypothetical protein